MRNWRRFVKISRIWFSIAAAQTDVCISNISVITVYFSCVSMVTQRDLCDGWFTSSRNWEYRVDFCLCVWFTWGLIYWPVVHTILSSRLFSAQADGQGPAGSGSVTLQPERERVFWNLLHGRHVGSFIHSQTPLHNITQVLYSFCNTLSLPFLLISTVYCMFLTLCHFLAVFITHQHSNAHTHMR